MDSTEDHPQVPSATERAAMMVAKPDSKLSPLGLARTNARVLLRQRFPGFSFRLRAHPSSNGDVQTLDVKWPEVPGAPSKDEVWRVLFPFWSMGSKVRPADDGMGAYMFRSTHGEANVMSIHPRPPTPKDLEVAMHRQLPSDTPSRPKARF